MLHMLDEGWCDDVIFDSSFPISVLITTLMMVVETAAAADEDVGGTPAARAPVAARPAWQTSRFSIVPAVCL